MTRQEIYTLMKQLRTVFDIVRLVDAAITTQYSLGDDGVLLREDYQCYAVWHKTERCDNCISAKAHAIKGKLNKFEFVNHEVYYVIAMYVEVEDEPLVLEMVSKITDKTLFGAYGKSEFIQTISNYNWKLYRDSLTGAYNRQYYEEQLRSLPQADGVAMVDVDHFKQINDTYGHRAGDLALQTIVHTLHANTRRSDAVVRFGGDEFLILFREMPREGFEKRLESIRKAVEKVGLAELPQLRLTVSIGGVYAPRSGVDAIAEADRLLYAAKESRNRVMVNLGPDA